ncbi:recombinase RecT [Frankia sp. Cj3]|uniref:recombinase RecT n=1 Tax=Frankia sp. Cj3 TaxID=2880976 RepID=UPI001EF4985E|nr:recombinase RecT [Frankia sp. Cj3]
MAGSTQDLRERAAQVQSNGGAVAVRPASPIDRMAGDVKRMESEFARALPAVGITADRFARLAVTVLRQNADELARCEPASVLGALVTAAQLGLEPGGPLGQCYLVRYGNQCTFVMGYKGYISLARRSGEIESLIARVVYERDEFSAEYGLEDKLTHKPYMDGDPGRAVRYYAVAKYVGGGHSFVVLSRAAVEKLRNAGRSANSPAWKNWYDEMACAKAVKQLAKWMPLTTEFARAVANDETTRTDRGEDVIDVPVYSSPDQPDVPADSVNLLDDVVDAESIDGEWTTS